MTGRWPDARGRGPARRAALLALAAGAGCAAGLAAAGIHLALGAPADASLFVAGLPWPWSAAADAASVLAAGMPGAAAVAGAAGLVAVRVAAGWVLLRATAAVAARPRPAPAGAAIALCCGAGLLADALGVAGGTGPAVVVLGVASTGCIVLAARAAGRVASWRGVAAGVVGTGFLLLLVPVQVRAGEALPAAGLAGLQGTLVLLAALWATPPRRGSACAEVGSRPATRPPGAGPAPLGGMPAGAARGRRPPESPPGGGPPGARESRAGRAPRARRIRPPRRRCRAPARRPAAPRERVLSSAGARVHPGYNARPLMQLGGARRRDGLSGAGNRLAGTGGRWAEEQTTPRRGGTMAVVTMRQLLEAGVHFGHQTRRWNPKMKRFIYGERNGIYIIDLQKTTAAIETTYAFLRDAVTKGGTVLLVGTKKQAQESIKQQAERVGMPFVNYRWLGGMLTNFSTIHKRLQRLKELEALMASDATDVLPKKEVLKLRHEYEKLERNLGGIRDMTRVPSAVWIVDTRKEHIAVSEARKLGIPVVAILDTNCDPDEVDYPIPGNDDAIRSGSLLTRIVADAIAEGLRLRSVYAPQSDAERGESGQIQVSPVDEEPLAEWERELLDAEAGGAAGATPAGAPADKPAAGRERPAGGRAAPKPGEPAADQGPRRAAARAPGAPRPGGARTRAAESSSSRPGATGAGARAAGAAKGGSAPGGKPAAGPADADAAGEAAAPKAGGRAARPAKAAEAGEEDAAAQGGKARAAKPGKPAEADAAATAPGADADTPRRRSKAAGTAAPDAGAEGDRAGGSPGRDEAPAGKEQG